MQQSQRYGKEHEQEREQAYKSTWQQLVTTNMQADNLDTTNMQTDANTHASGQPGNNQHASGQPGNNSKRDDTSSLSLSLSLSLKSSQVIKNG